MARNPLDTVIRLRHLALDEARHELGRCLAVEEATIAELRAAEAAIHVEESAAASLDTDDGAVEAFAAWLPRGRQAIALAESARARAEAATAQARARLAGARAAAEAADRMAQTRLAAAQVEALHREQAALDEIGQRSRDETR